MKTDELDHLLQQASVSVPDLPSALMDRILADADALQPRATVLGQDRASGFWGTLVRALGGGFGISGLGVATLMGVWVGFAQPVPLDSFIGQDISMESVELVPNFDEFLAEG